MKGELIGLMVKVIRSANKSNTGIKGKVIDETMNTLVIEKDNEKKILSKDQNEFEFPEKKIRIDGGLLLGRPEDRIKKIR